MSQFWISQSASGTVKTMYARAQSRCQYSPSAMVGICSAVMVKTSHASSIVIRQTDTIQYSSCVKEKKKKSCSKDVMSDEDFAAENESQMNEFRSETHDELYVRAIGHKSSMSIEEECKMYSPLFLV